MSTLHLLYHELRPTRTAYTYALDLETFAAHLTLFRAIPNTHPILPAITFDDGHRSNHDYALPQLLAHNLHARFFITAGWTGHKPDYMTPAHLRALHAAGQHIGAHGWTHTLLTHCTPAQLHQELHDPRAALEDILGAPVTTLSLPGGRSNRRVLEACRQAGYTQIFTSIPRPEPNLTAPTLGRLNILATMPLPWIATLFTPQTPLPRLERTYRLKQAAQTLLGDHLYARLWSLWNHRRTND